MKPRFNVHLALAAMLICCITISCKKLNVPVVETIDVTEIRGTSVKSGGVIIDDGGSTIITRGVCWSKEINPTINDQKSSDGAGAGSFASEVSSLAGSTTYYLRAYATNGDGTGYGMTMSFTTLPVIGYPHEGGIVFYLDQSGIHGLMAAPSDQSSGLKWYNNAYVTTNATSTSLGSGMNNTTAIVNIQGGGSYAAKLCYDLSLNSHSDWYLPSKNELNLMYLTLKANGIGSFTASHYWSSTEISNTNAWYQFFGDGGQATATKDYLYSVRAIRSF